MIWIALLFLQAPSLEELRSAKIDSTDCLLLRTSQTGKYLVLGRSESLEVYTAADLKLAKELPLPWTTAGFDENDAHLVVVGKELIRFNPADWTELSRNPLEHSAIAEPRIRVRASNSLLPRQAWIYPDGSVLYRSVGGGVRHADWDGGKLVSKVIVTRDENPEYPVRGIIGMSPQTLLLDLGGAAGVLSGTKVYYLIASPQTFFAESMGGATVLVGESFEGIYDSRTWKAIAHRTEVADGDAVRNRYSERSSEGSRSAAAIDQKSGWVFVAGEKGLRSWNPSDFTIVQRYAAVPGPCRQLAIDGSQRLLYTVEPAILRCWRIKD
jgi:hypothetical protein